MRKCPVCKAPIVGRRDKVYCSLTCKSVNQYERRCKEERFFQFVDRQLKINRKILKRFNQSGFTTLQKEVLIQEGFNPRYFTHYWKNGKAQVYLFSFDYGFLEIEREGKKKYLLVEWQQYMEKG